MADALEDLLISAAGRKPAGAKPAVTDMPSGTTSNDGRLQILMDERSKLLARVKGKDKEDSIRAAKDLEGLDREITRLGGKVPAASSDGLESIMQNIVAPQSQSAKTNVGMGAQTVPGSPEAKAYEQQVAAQAAEKEKKRHMNESFISRFIAPIVDVPLAVATAPLGMISEQLTGSNIAYQPQSPTSQDILGSLQKGFEASKLEGLMGTPILSPKAQVTTPKLAETLPKQVRPAGVVPAAPRVEPTFEPKPLAGVGSAKSEFNPYGGQISGEESVRGAYPTVKLSKIRADVPAAEQNVRREIVKDVFGEETGGIRQGVLTGNEDTLRNEAAIAKEQSPRGQLMKDQMAKEQIALSNYAQERVNRSGANQNFVNDYERGQLINDAFAGDDGLTGWFKQQKNDLYTQAKAQVGDNPISTSHVDSLLADKQFRAGLGLKGNENVARAAEELIGLAKNVGFQDEFGNFHPANSISAWDAVRKALNANWTKDNANVIRQINQAIDKDVAAAGGGDLYKAADRMHKAEKVLFESKGIKNIFGEIDPNGVQTGAAFETIPQKLNSMPFDQWRHIYDTADQVSKGFVKVGNEMIPVPEEVRMAAQATKNEMSGALARDVQSAGGGKVGEWNANAANKRLNALDQKIRHAFPPEEVQAFHRLNYAGQLVPQHGYEGAGLQTKRLERLSEKLPSAGATVGAKLGGAPGAAVGEFVGEKAGGLFKGRTQKKAAERLRQQLEENFRKGKE